MIRGLYLDPVTHDLVLVNGDIVWNADPRTSTAQEIKTRQLLFKGENFLDLRDGMPYYQEIFQKGTPPERIAELFRLSLLSVPSVIDVPRCEVEINPSTRVGQVVWTARTDDGQLIRSEDFEPLILSP